MIDTSETLIIIKGQIKTSEIASCDYANGKYNVTYKNTSQVYSYNEENVLCMKHPVRLAPENYHLTYKGKVLSGIEQISVFTYDSKRYWHIRFLGGKEYNYKETGLKIERSCLGNTASDNVFRYLQEVAAAHNLKADDGTKLLSIQYKKIRFIADNRAIAPYLNPSKYKLKQTAAPILIFPFGSNASQQKAVRTAFENQLSIIQGPPGTGKTQTILNIIANILVQGKTVQIVSNNNSAIENVLEKLDTYQLGFLAALLGSSENKQKFIEKQTQEKTYPKEMASWQTAKADDPRFLQVIHTQTKELEKLFAKQERLAIARQEKQAVETEWRHYRKEFKTSEPALELRRRFSSVQLLYLWNKCRYFAESKQTGVLGMTKLFRRLQWLLFQIKGKVICKISDRDFFKRTPSAIITDFHLVYYQAKQTELQTEIRQLEKELAAKNATEINRRLTEASLTYLKNTLYRRYGGRHTQKTFELEKLQDEWQTFLQEYPVILSTTFSSISSLHENAVYDYLIMDEASQVSIETGVLPLSCARNAVIVGDIQQLPNVVTTKDKVKLATISNKYRIATGYDCAALSFLQSLGQVIPSIPQTLLREHYRCHPKIINFCNQKFYGGNLVIMTHDHGETNVISAIKTVEGQHARNRLNLREIAVIKEEVLPTLAYNANEIGVIAPYNNQVNAAKSVIKSPVEIATVHKFQGREKEAIVMSTVDNTITPFSDDPNLLNVAVSRAKHRFCLVVSGNEQPKECNISDLLAYIAYNDGPVVTSKIHSIFDYLYEQYAAIRTAYLKKHKRISEYDSENLTFALLENILQSHVNMCHLRIVCHLPLYMLIQDDSLLSAEERSYAAHPSTHLDFLIYNRVSKQPVLAIETDGYTFHQAGTRQAERDLKKNHILAQYGISLIRLSTIEHNEEKIIENKLMELLQYADHS